MSHDTDRHIEASRRLIHEVRARLRRSHGVRGVGLCVAAVAAAVVVSFGFDRLLDLPVAVRAVHLAIALVALVLMIRWAFRPLRMNPGDEAIAEAIEHEVPEFQDGLVSSLDFEARLRDPSEPESREMMAAAVRDTAAVAARIDPSLLVDGRPARRALALAAGALIAVVAVEVSFGDEFSLWIQRGLLLRDVSWPRRTNILVEGFPESGPLVITRGDDLRIVARAEGWQPADLDLHIEELADTDDPADAGGDVTSVDVRKMFPVPDQPARYAFDFRAVGASFRFWVTGGDDQDDRPAHEVKALLAPRIGKFEAEVVPPAYAGVPPSTVHDPVFEVLTGSKVTLRLTTNMPVVAARLRPSEGAAQDLPVGPDGRTLSASFDLERTLEFHVELKAAAGQTNRNEDDVFRIEAVADRAPTVRMLYPHGRIVATPDAIIPVKLLADDDFGLAEVALDVRQGTAGAWTSRIWPLDRAPATAPAPAASQAPARHVHVYRALDLVDFKGDQGAVVKVGDVLTLVVRAKDAGGLESAGTDIAVEIVSPDDLAQRVSTEMQRLREDLGKARTVQRRTVGEIRALQKEVGPEVDGAAVRRARDLQVDEGRVANDASRFTTGIFRVFDTLVLDRLGSVPTVDRLLPIYHEHLMEPPDDAGEVFPAALYARIVAEKRANRLYDPELLGILLDVMDLSERLREQECPAAFDALERWADSHAPQDIEAALAGARDVLATLDSIDERLQRFDDMSAILQLARAVRDELDSVRKKAQPPEKSK